MAVSAAEALHGHLGELGTALDGWETRDDSKAQPEVRRVANTAMDAIDACSATCTRCAHASSARSATPTPPPRRGLMPCWDGCGVISG
jgi:hypothetical protein